MAARSAIRAERKLVIVCPGGKRTRREGTVIELRLARDLRPHPGRYFDGLVLIAQLDFRDHEAFNLAGEDIDLPYHTGVRHKEAVLFDHDAATKRNGSLRLQHGNGVFELQPSPVGAPR